MNKIYQSLLVVFLIGITITVQAQNVGIGVATPSSKLHIVDNSAANTKLLVASDNTSGIAEVLVLNTVRRGGISMGIANNLNTYGDPGETYLYSSVNMLGLNIISANNGGNGHIGFFTSGNHSGASTLYLSDNDRVGIGTEVPSEKFHLVGNARISSLSGVNNRLVQSSAAGVLSDVADGTVGQVLTTNGIGGLTWGAPASGNTLNMAYDEGGPGVGRTIVADAGTVEINGTGGLSVDANTTTLSDGIQVNNTNGTYVTDAKLGYVGTSGANVVVQAVRGNAKGTQATSGFDGIFGVIGLAGHINTNGTVNLNATVGSVNKAIGVYGGLDGTTSYTASSQDMIASVLGLTGFHNNGGGGGAVSGGGRIYAGLFAGNGRILGLWGENSCFMEMLPRWQVRDLSAGVVGFYNASANAGTDNSDVGTGDNYLSIEANVTNATVKHVTLQTRTTGNVGIGTASPSSKLEVNGRIESGRQGYVGTYNATEVQGIWSIGTPYGINTATNDFGSQYGICYAHTNAGTSGTKKPIAGWGHQILFTSNGNRNAVISMTNGYAYFNGRIGANTTSPTADLSVNGSANKTGGGTWAVFSDARLKENITNYSEGLDFIKKVRPVNFSYNNKMEEIWGKDEVNKGRVYQGVIAQELQKIAPDMVRTVSLSTPEADADTAAEITTTSTVSENYLEVDPNKFTYALINAVKEQQVQIEELRKEIEKLKEHKK